MPMDPPDVTEAEPSVRAALPWWKRSARLWAPSALLVAVVGVSGYWMTHKPTARRRPPQVRAPLVEVRPVTPESKKVVVRAMGTVVPARQIQLAAQVSGRVIKVAPELVPGGFFAAGEQILQVEPKDYSLAIEQRASELANAQCDLKVELGQQSVARKEYELLGKSVKQEDEELILRKPQLAKAQAAVAAASASLEKARLDLRRTSVTAPFNAVVDSRGVDLGSLVSVGTPLATLVGTDEYWVQVTVPLDELRWLDIPGPQGGEGSPARVLHEVAWGEGVSRPGTVKRLMASLESEGRMAQLIVAVPDPLDRQAGSSPRHTLVIGSFVRVEITGRQLDDAYCVNRTSVRDGDRVWVMQPDDTLDIREVEVAWSGDETVCLTNGLNEGDLLVTSDLAAPLQGMRLRTADSQRPPRRLVDGDAGSAAAGSL